MKNTTTEHKNSGFSLIEMSILVAVMGLMVAGVLSGIPVEKETNKLDVTEERMARIQTAIEKFVDKRGDIPCPADGKVAPNDSSFGIESDCTFGALPSNGFIDIVPTSGVSTDTIRIGTVPTRALGLSDRDAFDGWGTRFTYAAIIDLTDSVTFGAYTSALTNGVINMQNIAGASQSTSPVAYALVSHGHDKRGGYNKAGTLNSCNSGFSAIDEENCDQSGTSTSIFTEGSISDHAADATYYYDIVEWEKLSKFATPTPPTPLVTWEPMLLASNKGGCAIDINHRAYCWGVENSSNYYGRNGNGAGNINEPTPQEITGSYTDWIYIDADERTTCGIRGTGDEGTLYCWGNDLNGSLGLGVSSGTVVQTPTVVQVGATTHTDWVKVQTSPWHVCALRSTGNLYCWGLDDAIGDNSSSGSSDKNTPTEVGSGSGGTVYTDWDDIATGLRVSCGLRGGEVYCWGDLNAWGQIGDNSTTNRFIPTKIYGSYTDWTNVYVGHTNPCALRSNGDLYCWGANSLGEVGQGTTTSYYTTPQLTLSGVASIQSGWNDALAVKTDGTLWGWGYNNGGQLGLGHKTITRAPTQVGTDTDWAWAHNTRRNSCGYKTDGTGYCWGRGWENEFGIGFGAEYLTPTTPGPSGLSFN